MYDHRRWFLLAFSGIWILLSMLDKIKLWEITNREGEQEEKIKNKNQRYSNYHNLPCMEHCRYWGAAAKLEQFHLSQEL